MQPVSSRNLPLCARRALDMLLKVGVMHAEFLFRAGAGRLLLLDVFLLNIVLASHVLGMSVMCIFKKVNPRKRPS